MKQYETTISLHDYLSISECKMLIEAAQGQADTQLITGDYGEPKALKVTWTVDAEYSEFDIAEHCQEIRGVSHYVTIERPTLVGAGLPIAAIEQVDRFEGVTK